MSEQRSDQSNAGRVLAVAELIRMHGPTRARVLVALTDGPKSSRELKVEPEFLHEMEHGALVRLDPDRWPDEYVPGNPLIARLPHDDRPWPGWKDWRV